MNFVPPAVVHNYETLIVENGTYRVLNKDTSEVVASGLVVEDTPPRLLEKFVQAVATYYKGDPTTAGVVLARIPDQQTYYMSICRYRGKYGKDKEIVAIAEEASIERATICLLVAWKTIAGVTATPEQRKILNETITP